MSKESEDCMDKKVVVKNCHHSHSESGALYGLGVIGALFYFLQGVSGFGAVMMGIGKAIFWPAFVVYKVLGMLGI